jgi:hypothetical protein
MNEFILVSLLLTVIICVLSLLFFSHKLLKYFFQSDKDTKEALNEINKRMLVLTSEVLFETQERLNQASIDSVEEAVQRNDKELAQSLAELRGLQKDSQETFNPFEISSEDTEDIIEKTSIL